MKLEDLAYNKVLGYEPKVNKINVPSQDGGIFIKKITEREFSFNGCIYTCKILMALDETVESIRMSYSKIPVSPIRTNIELTNITSNEDIKNYFESILLRLKVTIDQVYSEQKIQNVFEYLRDLGAVLKVVDDKIYFELDGFGIEIKLNSNDEWDIYLNGKQISTHKTLQDAAWDMKAIRKKNFALIPNIV